MSGAWLGSTFRDLTSLRRGARALAAALPRLGAANPSTVVLLARNSFLPLEVTMAVALTGARVVAGSPHATAARPAACPRPRPGASAPRAGPRFRAGQGGARRTGTWRAG